MLIGRPIKKQRALKMSKFGDQKEEAGRTYIPPTLPQAFNCEAESLDKLYGTDKQLDLCLLKEQQATRAFRDKLTEITVFISP